ncbi:MAG: hypothetical protein ACT6QZ_10570, partial [Methylophilus sp.]
PEGRVPRLGIYMYYAERMKIPLRVRAKKLGDLNYFISKMTPLKDQMDRFYKPNLIIRAYRKAKRILGI